MTVNCKLSASHVTRLLRELCTDPTALPWGKAPQLGQELGNEGLSSYLLLSCKVVAFQAGPDKRSHHKGQSPGWGNRAHVIAVSFGCVSQSCVPDTAAINCGGVPGISVLGAVRRTLGFFRCVWSWFCCLQRQLLLFKPQFAETFVAKPKSR